MRLSLGLCLLVFLGAICMASGDSSKVEKRFFSGSVTKVVRTVVRKVNRVVSSNNPAKSTATVTKAAVGATKNVGTGVASVGKKVGQTVAGVTKKVGQDVTGATKTVGQNVVDITQKIGHGVADVTDKVGQGVSGVTKVVIQKLHDFFDGSGIYKVGRYTINIVKEVASNDILADGVEFVADVSEDVKDGVVDVTKHVATFSEKVGKGVTTITKNVYKDIYETAKHTFDNLPELFDINVNFDDFVLSLIDKIDSKIMKSGCKIGCATAAKIYLGTVGGVVAATVACDPACKAVLAKLDDLAEKVAHEVMEKDGEHR